jgi:hypothetical protein
MNPLPGQDRRTFLNGFRIVSHWHPNGPDSGAWPPSPGVLRSFRTLQHRFGA